MKGAGYMTILVLLWCGMVALVDMPGDPWKAPPEADRLIDPLVDDAKAIVRGQKVFSSLCWTCHGTAGKGDGPAAAGLPIQPANFSDPSVQAQSNGALFWKITHGRGVMPTYQEALSREERWAVVHYLRTLSP